MSLKYTIDCVQAGGNDFLQEKQWLYRITLWCGKTGYRSNRAYENYDDAAKAAAKTGAKPSTKN